MTTYAPNDHRLEFLDQAALELMRATGRNQLMQCVWVYEHPLSDEGLKRFHHNLYASLGSRLIDGFAKKMADEFFTRFQDALEAPEEGADEGEAPAEANEEAPKKGWFKRMIGA